MTEALFSSLADLFAWPAIAYMVGACVIGLMVGILPGLGSVFAITLFLPIAAQLDPLYGIIFIVALFTVTQAGGEITSILFAVPGEMSSVTTILDGHPLAARGKAGLALSVSFTTNIVGGAIGAVVLLLAVPIARPLILNLGNPELFMCVIVGVTFIGSLTGRRRLIGYTVAFFGFLLALVGTSVISGAPRYTFGIIGLWQGVPLICFALGFFAVPELYRLYVTGNNLRASRFRVRSDFWNGITESLRRWRLIWATSWIGVIIGIIPGLGGSVAQWVSYSYAKRRSKHPEEFGRGSIDGLIAPSASCNAKDGGQLLPTLFFGIPGGVSMSLLLVAMLTLDIAPGPQMVTENLDLTMAIVWVLLIANTLGVLMAAASVKWLVYLASIPTAYMIPVLMSMVLLAAYSARQSMLGVILLIIGSIIGVTMEILDWPRAPFILAFVLAPLAEKYLFLALQTYGWAGSALRPGVIVLFVILVSFVVWSVRAERRERDAEVRSVHS